MFNHNSTLGLPAILALSVFLQACSDAGNTDENQQALAQEYNVEADKVVPQDALVQGEAPQQLEWEALMPDGFKPDDIYGKYEEEIKQFGAHDYSEKSVELFTKINNELKAAPVNDKLNQKLVRIPGFIAPLQHANGELVEFLLVPYFGACIHSPPPPLNQTVLVKAKIGDGIRGSGIEDPIWVTGVLTTEGENTKIGDAGYRISNAKIEPYTEEDDI